MKKIMSLVLSIVLLLNISSHVFAAGNDEYGAEVDCPENEIYISRELRQNARETLINSAFLV
jgi:hypothetical protein